MCIRDSPHSDPIAQQPRPISETLQPILENCLNFIIIILHLIRILEFEQLAHY